MWFCTEVSLNGLSILASCPLPPAAEFIEHPTRQDKKKLPQNKSLFDVSRGIKASQSGSQSYHLPGLTDKECVVPGSGPLDSSERAWPVLAHTFQDLGFNP